MSPDSPRVESFVLRFVQDVPELGASVSTQTWHTVIMHVQSNEEKTYTHFADAVAFIARYVPIGDFSFPADSGSSPLRFGDFNQLPAISKEC